MYQCGHLHTSSFIKHAFFTTTGSHNSRLQSLTLRLMLICIIYLKPLLYRSHLYSLELIVFFRKFNCNTLHNILKNITPKKRHKTQSFYHITVLRKSFLHLIKPTYRFLRSNYPDSSAKLEHPAVKGRTQVYRNFYKELIF